MQSIPVYDAKARFSELLALVQDGEEVCITKRGLPVARIVGMNDGDVSPEPPGVAVACRFGRLRDLGFDFAPDEDDLKAIWSQGRR